MPEKGLTRQPRSCDAISMTSCAPAGCRASSRLASRIIERDFDMAKKGYWIGHVNITNPERYKDYIAANAEPFKTYGARFLVRNGECEVPEGGLGGRRHVVLEFESYAVAKACYDS